MTDDLYELVTSLPCPSWCQEPAGHPYREECGDIQRWHRARMGTLQVEQLDWHELGRDGVQVATDGAQVTIPDANGKPVDLAVEQLAGLLPDLQQVMRLLA